MTCTTCGFEHPVGIKFSGDCGGRLHSSCAACGAENPPAFKFCGACGTAMTIATSHKLKAESQIRTQPPAPIPPHHLAEKILTSRAALEGERKQVTVLFADVKGSMDLAEQLDPEEWHKNMDRFFQILTDGVHRFEGTVNQHTGDGIMALLAAPIAHEDHATACLVVRSRCAK